MAAWPGVRIGLAPSARCSATRRRRCFVGREAELELVRAALDAAEPPFSVLWFTGPGGIGKSSLLDRVAEHAEESRGASVVRLDGRELTPSPREVTDALRERARRAAGGRAARSARRHGSFC